MNITENVKNNKFTGFMQGLGAKMYQSRPEIMMAIGGVSLLIGTIVLCTKTEKGKQAIAEYKEDLQKIDNRLKLPEPSDGIDVLPETVEANKMEKGRRYLTVTGIFLYKMLKIYGVPALLWAGGMSLMVGGHTDLKKRNKALASQIIAGTKALTDYRARVKASVGDEAEEKIFMGAQPGKVTVLEKDEKTGEEKYVSKKADEFVANPGSIFAVNFVEENVDFKWRAFPEEVLDERIRQINQNFEWGLCRALSGMEILRQLGFTEDGLGYDDEKLKMLLINGISANGRKVQDPEMRKLKVTRLNGYQKRYDPNKEADVWVPCTRLDFNFYPLEGKI